MGYVKPGSIFRNSTSPCTNEYNFVPLGQSFKIFVKSMFSFIILSIYILHTNRIRLAISKSHHNLCCLSRFQSRHVNFRIAKLNFEARDSIILLRGVSES